MPTHSYYMSLSSASAYKSGQHTVINESNFLPPCFPGIVKASIKFHIKRKLVFIQMSAILEVNLDHSTNYCCIRF